MIAQNIRVDKGHHLARLLHTSDILLGESFPHAHKVADRLRSARLEALRTVLALAKREEVDALVIAGNLFADNRVGVELINEAAQILNKSAVPVYLLPGHRDPITPDSPYQLYADRFQNNVHLMLSKEPVVLPDGIVLYPCPVDFREATGDPTKWIPERGKERLRLGVVCTDPEGYRLPPNTLDNRDLDHLIAGGRLSQTTEAAIHYPGTPEPSDFGQTSGQVSLLHLSPTSITIEARTVAEVSWVEEELEVASAADIDLLTKRWSADENRASTVLKLTLRGQLDQLAAVETARRTLEAKLLHLDLRNEIVPSIDGAYRNPLLKAVAATLAEKAKQPTEYDSTSIAPEDAEVARAALAQLMRILENAQHGDLV